MGGIKYMEILCIELMLSLNIMKVVLLYIREDKLFNIYKKVEEN